MASSDGKPRPFWSVMIPIHNPRLDYLEETLCSVMSQAPAKDQMQIEILDDASPNGTPFELIRKIAGDRIIVHSEPRNLGLAGIWNRCIERAHGEWVHILHQDDLVFPGFYESLRHGIELHPQVGAAYCRHAYCDEHGHWQRLSILEMSTPGVLEHFVEPLVTTEHIQCASIVVRKSTYDLLGGFNPNLKHALDWEMWIRIANKFSIFYEPKILACWRNHSGATTSRQIRSGENIRDIFTAIDIWSHYLPDGGRLSEIAFNHFAQVGLLLARRLLAQDDFEGSLNQVNAALSRKKSFRLRWDASKIKIKAHAKPALKRWRTRNYLKKRPGATA